MVTSSKHFFMTLSLLLTLASCGKNGGYATMDDKATIFLTAVGHPGNFGGSAAADTACMTDANHPGSGTYKAMVVDSARRACSTNGCSGGVTEHLNWVLAPNTTYYRLADGAVIGTTNANGIFTFPLTNSWAAGSTLAVWTALDTTWTSNGSNCTNWTTNGAGPTTKNGMSDEVNTDAISHASTPSCSSTIRFICVKQ